MATHMRVVSVTQANFTHDIDAQAFDFMSKLGANEFHNHAGEADVLILINLGRQQAHIVVLHGEHAALELHKTIAKYRIGHNGLAIDAFLAHQSLYTIEAVHRRIGCRQ